MFRAFLLLSVGISVACGDDGGQTGEPSSGVVVASLVVKADGEPIGYLVSLGEYGWTLDIWNPDLGIRFSVNQATGYIVRRFMYEWFEGDDCTGKVYRREYGLDSTQCNALEAGPPIRRVIGADNDTDGFTRASSLLTTSDDLAWFASHSNGFTDNCFGGSVGQEMCGSLVTTTDVIPTAFPLPIEVVEE